MSTQEGSSKEAVLRAAQERGVRLVQLQFTDILGLSKHVAIPVGELGRALETGIVFDGGSIEGFVRSGESDCYLLPDAKTFAVFPWERAGEATARLICDIVAPDGSPSGACPRTALKRVLAEAQGEGLQLMVGSEPEFFLLRQDDSGEPTLEVHDHAGYFDLGPADRGEDARKDMVLALTDMGFAVSAAHHEVAPGQHEIDFAPQPALLAADSITTFRFLARTVALRHGLHATFMPKPFFGRNGSGMHLQQYLVSGGENAFYEPGGDLSLGRRAYNYMAGVMDHISAITAIANPLVNSYKRLLPGYEAPIYVSWSAVSRSPLIRVPQGTAPEDTHLEMRSPDAACNPYLALACFLKAGLDGIRRGAQPPRPVDRNVHRMTESERRGLHIERLPRSLDAAVGALREDAVIRETLGEHIFEHLVRAKTIEWDIYQAQVHPWEREQYLKSF